METRRYRQGNKHGNGCTGCPFFVATWILLCRVSFQANGVPAWLVTGLPELRWHGAAQECGRGWVGVLGQECAGSATGSWCRTTVLAHPWPQESQPAVPEDSSCRRFTQDSWGRPGPLEAILSHPSSSRDTRSWCPGPRPGGFRTSPRIQTPRPCAVGNLCQCSSTHNVPLCAPCLLSCERFKGDDRTFAWQEVVGLSASPESISLRWQMLARTFQLSSSKK